MKKWFDTFPSLPERFKKKGEHLSKRKDMIRVLEAMTLAEEAALWEEIGLTGNYTRKQMAAALIAMDPKVLSYLPNKMVSQ